MSHVHTLGGSGCMPPSSPLPINSCKGWSRGQSGWRVNLDPPPWMFRWCHKRDLWPRSPTATRPMLNLNFRGPNASVHTQTHAYIYSRIHMHFFNAGLGTGRGKGRCEFVTTNLNPAHFSLCIAQISTCQQLAHTVELHWLWCSK